MRTTFGPAFIAFTCGIAFAFACGGDGGDGSAAPGAAGGSDAGGDASAPGTPGSSGDVPRPDVDTVGPGLLAAGRVGCAVAAGGALRCWGVGRAPQAVGAGQVWTDVAVDDVGGGCAVRDDGTVWCFAAGAEPVQQPVGATNRRVALRGTNRCVVTAAGELFCWGTENGLGQLGTRDRTARADPTRIGSGDGWRSVSMGTRHTCALDRSGALFCWGAGADGQVGDGEGGFSGYFVSAPTAIARSEAFVSVSAGDSVTCAVRVDGRLLCWGRRPELHVDANAPTPIGDDVDWVRVEVGEGHACALKRDGSVHCWGQNHYGQVGLAPTVDVAAPTPVSAVAGASAVAVGLAFSCARVGDDVRCWGRNLDGELGEPPPVRRAPWPVAGTWSGLTASGKTVCAVDLDGKLACWGALRHLSARPRSSAPAAIVEEDGWQSIGLGAERACGARAGGSLWCWGSRWSTATPQAMGVSGVTAFVFGAAQQCALAGTTPWCWGQNVHNEFCGPGALTEPAPILVPETWTSIGANNESFCGTRPTGELVCCGLGYGTTGEEIGTDTDWTVVAGHPSRERYYVLRDGRRYSFLREGPPALADAATDWQDYERGPNHGCGLRSGGAVWCDGANGSGQLGDGTTASRSEAVRAGAAGGYGAVAVGDDFSCALRGTTIDCWGANDEGQLGDGEVFSHEPRVVP